MNLLMKYQTSLKMGHVGSKTRSVGQILCTLYRPHLSPIIIKHGQSVCLDETSVPKWVMSGKKIGH